MTIKEPSILIIIPNWNGKKYLEKCIPSILNQTYSNFKLIIIDNGSIDDSVKYIKDNHQNIIIIENKNNEGFPRACNKGINYALSNFFRYVLLLNNDTIHSNNFLYELINCSNKYSLDITSSKIYYSDDPNKIWFDGGQYIYWRSSWKFKNWQKLEEKNDNNEYRESDFVTGCTMLIKTNVFKKIGLLYEPYFLICEDTDFCFFAKKNNFKIGVAQKSLVWHKISGSQLGEFSFFNGYYGTRNRLYFSFYRNKNYLGGLFIIFIIIPIRTIQWIVQGKKNMLKGMIYGFIDFLKGRMGEYKIYE